MVPLTVLFGGFEAVWTLHVGVERIGRFIQVSYESGDGASWETSAMRASPGLPGSGADPLFSVVFAVASLVNLGVAFVAQPTAVEIVLLFAAHAALLLRLARARMRGRPPAARRPRRVQDDTPADRTVSTAVRRPRDFAEIQELPTNPVVDAVQGVEPDPTKGASAMPRSAAGGPLPGAG